MIFSKRLNNVELWAQNLYYEVEFRILCSYDFTRFINYKRTSKWIWTYCVLLFIFPPISPDALISSQSLKKKFGIKRNLVFEESRNLSTMNGKKCTYILAKPPHLQSRQNWRGGGLWWHVPHPHSAPPPNLDPIEKKQAQE